MRFNFYITAENDEEAKACIDFIRRQTDKREDAAVSLPKFTPSKSVPIAADDDDEPMPRANVDPGASAIGKIGSSTKDTLINMLNADMQPAEKYAEHLKLLWHRGEVKFDGSLWYL